MGSWEKSLDMLMSGNERFVLDECRSCRSYDAQRKELLEEGAHPAALVIAPPDPYMAPEIVFDVDLGELYVLRLPELEIDRSVLDEVAFAAEKLHTPLCMILAHEARSGDPEEGGFWDRFRGGDEPAEEIVKACVRRLRGSSELQELMRRGEFLVVGAKYDMESGRVTVFDF